MAALLNDTGRGKHGHKVFRRQLGSKCGAERSDIDLRHDFELSGWGERPERLIPAGQYPAKCKGADNGVDG